MIILGFLGVYLGGDVYNLFRVSRGQTANQIMGIFGSIVLFIVGNFLTLLAEKGICSLLKRKNRKTHEVCFRDTWDLLEPGAFAVILVTKVRCLNAGCCYGIPCSWGFYNWIAKEKVFPVQIAEIIMTTTVLIVVYHLKRKPFYRRGMALFLAAGLWSFGRFFLEYLMFYLPEDRTYLGIFTFWQVAAILVEIVCITVIVILYKRYPPEPRSKALKQAGRRDERRGNRKKKNKKR